MDPQTLLDLASQHKWFAFSALIIGFLVRLLKNDNAIFPTVITKWKPWVALGLGLASGVLEKMNTGTTWRSALLWGLASAMTAIVGHETLVESLRGGREFGAPKGPPPPSQKPKGEKKLKNTDDVNFGKDEEKIEPEAEGEATPPVTKKIVNSLLSLRTRFQLKLAAIALFACLLSCKDPKTANEVKGVVLDIEQVACVLLQSALGMNEPAAVTTACNLAPVLTQDVVRLLAANQKAGARLLAMKVAAPAPSIPVPCAPTPTAPPVPPTPIASTAAPIDAGSPAHAASPTAAAKKDGGK